MARTRHEDRIEISFADRPVHVGVYEAEARRRAEMAKESRLDVLGRQPFAEKRIVEQIDLPD